MIEHNIKAGISTALTKVTNSNDSMPSVTHDFLVSTPAVINMIIEASRPNA